MDSNSNTFRTSNETLFLVNILNTMYNDNLNQINNLTELLNNLNNSNNQIRSLLVQLLNRNRSNRRNETRRVDTNFNNLFNNLTNNITPEYFIGEYTVPINRIRHNNNSNNANNRNRISTLDDYTRSIYENFFQPVEVYPTQSQIEAATRRVRYCDIARPINTSCPISMDEFNDSDMVTVIRHCGHVFHNEQIMNWFRSNCRCPVCRYNIREYNSNVSNQFFNHQDSSGNNIERNNNNNNNIENLLINHTFGSGMTNIDLVSLENLLLNNNFDSSGNHTNNQTSILTTFIELLNSTRNIR